MGDPGERRIDVDEVVVLLLDRPLKTESRFGLWECALDFDRV